MAINIERDREEGDFFVLLSQVGPKKLAKATSLSPPGRVFQCKSCDRRFSSFQALGGHRASHKKPRLSPDGDLELWPLSKPKTHECTICGQEFAIGQALGGHMRRHRSTAGGGGFAATSPSPSQSLAVMKKSNSSSRVLCLDLDLNLTPLENDLKFRFGTRTTTLQCFL